MRRPDTPCANGCGRLLYGGNGSLPSGQRTCRDCRRLRREAQPQAAKREPNQQPLCEVCDQPYRASYKGQRTCGRACGVELRFQGQACMVPWRDCIGCTTRFIGHRGRKYCDACRQTTDCYYWLVRRPAQLVPMEPRECRECGKHFMPNRQPGSGQPRRLYCSARCAHRADHRACRHRERARKHDGRAYEPVTLLQIAKRDNWRCHICRKRVTRTTWSLDHLVPLSVGGTHTRDNLALAHHRCNTLRGVDRLPAQLLLIG